MTTPTREQVIEWAKEAKLPAVEYQLASDDAWANAQRFAAIVLAAGRDQGLREAKEVCEAEILEGPSNEASFYNKACDDCAAAIEQLRWK